MTLYEIFTKVQNNENVDYTELSHALLVYQSLLYFANRDIEILSKNPSEFMKKMTIENSFIRHKGALNENPTKWLGNSIPENTQYQKEIKICRNIYNKFSKYEDSDDE